MRTYAWHAFGMDTLGGPELKAQRIAAFGYDDRAEFAQLVGVKPRTVEGWESKKGHVPTEKAQLVRQVLARHRPSWETLSDVDLLAALTDRLREYGQIARRLADIEQSHENVTEIGKPLSDSADNLPQSPGPGGRFTGRSGGPPVQSTDPPNDGGGSDDDAE